MLRVPCLCIDDEICTPHLILNLADRHGDCESDGGCYACEQIREQRFNELVDRQNMMEQLFYQRHPEEARR